MPSPATTRLSARPGVRPETWAYGFRNPWRLHIDPPTGDVWVGQNGQDLWEQVYLVQRGKNYGWSIVEGTHPFYPERKAGPDPIAKPIAEHHHSEARSLTGGLVYRGKLLGESQGCLHLWRLVHWQDLGPAPQGRPGGLAPGTGQHHPSNHRLWLR